MQAGMVKEAVAAYAIGISAALQELGMDKQAADEYAFKEAATPAAFKAVKDVASQGVKAVKGYASKGKEKAKDIAEKVKGKAMAVAEKNPTATGAALIGAPALASGLAGGAVGRGIGDRIADKIENKLENK